MYQISYIGPTGKYGWSTFYGSYWGLEDAMAKLRNLGYTRVAAMKL